MLPQNAGVTVTSLSAPPNLDVSMTLNINTMLGRNKINRLAHSTANFYSGTSQVDNTLELPIAGIDPQTQLPVPYANVINLQTPSKILQLSVTRPITVLVTVNSVESQILVNKLLVLDSPVSKIDLRNMDTQNSAQVIISYLQ